VFFLLGSPAWADSNVSDQAAEGRELIESHGCLACHSQDGSAASGPSLQDVVERTSPEHVKESITDPKAVTAEGYPEGAMPAYPLSDAELDAVVAALSEPIPEEEASKSSSMWIVGLASVLFVLSHLFLSSGRVRPRLVEAMGEKGFMGFYSVVALGTLIWAWMAWETAPYVELWPAAAWTRWVPNIGMPIVCILVLAGYTTPSPTVAGTADTLDQEDVAQGILRVTRHPANMGFTFWGLLHLFPNGDLATFFLIFAFSGLGILGTWHIEARRKASHGAAWQAYVDKTSVIPFLAIVQGRQHLSLKEIGAARILGGLAIWGVLLMGHQWMIGASPFPV
jgi:uncharacterized membrane protein/cytochrome c551/c552